MYCNEVMLIAARPVSRVSRRAGCTWLDCTKKVCIDCQSSAIIHDDCTMVATVYHCERGVPATSELVAMIRLQDSLLHLLECALLHQSPSMQAQLVL